MEKKCMNTIIKFPNNEIMELRNRCVFINKSVSILSEAGVRDYYPCIVLYEESTNVPIEYTGYERYLCNLQKSELLKGKTLAKKAYAVCHFLNYVLKNTNINSLSECTNNVIRDFFKSMKKKDGTEYDPLSLEENKGFIIDFLSLYYDSNSDLLHFNYDGDKLKFYKFVKDENNKKICIEGKSKLGLKRKRKTHKKNRILIYEHLDLLLYVAKKYDPELELGIAMQAFSGIREGEVVNVTCGRVKIKPGNFKSHNKIVIGLTEKAPYFQKWDKKTDPGSIKKPREQEVYKDFIFRIKQLYDYHISLMESKGYSVDKDAPLFINKQGKPMTVQTYQNRVRTLFYERFIPALEIYCEQQGTYSENIAYIDAYKNEYPGAHMFRHWFTMYLLTKAKLTQSEIAKWRGDENEKSMIDYVHENDDMICAFRESSFSFQMKLLEDINDI